tara:strand:- start:15784 stop:16302 length:519 start_codon:yes stop_codon:yes gene_type:complete
MKSKQTTQWHGVVIPFDHDREKFTKLRLKFSSGSQQNMSDALGLNNQNLISRFESGEFDLDPRTFSLFSLITDSHPKYLLTQRQKNYGSLLIEAPASGKERREYRVKAKLTGQEMADIMQLTSKTTISAYEHEKKNPSIQNWTIFLLVTNQHPYYKISPKFVPATYKPMVYK